MKVYRHINGISLNGREYLLNEDDTVKEFRDEAEVKEYLELHHNDDLEEYGIFLTEED
ncbi:MAG: hypothetical protein PQJ59_01670 [Spirochaetales bacterium]|nr:hypothetical protein [Spirochaetales bacterium]